LEGEINRGPTASIYRATAPENGQPVAIKVFHARYHADPRFAIRFREHLRRLAGLSHDNLVPVLDYGVDQTQYYVVTEWVDGTDLGTYLTEYGSLPSTLTIFIARQVCAALDAIHQHGLVHQGIKPQNILFTADGRVKVTDIGMSRLLSDSGLSKTHVMLTGVGYISPEQARGKRLAPQSDIYSLGVTLFEMLTGRLPFEGNDAWSVVRMHAMETPPSPQQFNQQVPEGLANIVIHALQKDPEQI
jgi:serine/threonine-protein kinase